METQQQIRFYSTREVARLIGVKPGTVGKAIWAGNIPTPHKGPGGAFLWTPADIDRAAHHFRKAVTL